MGEEEKREWRDKQTNRQTERGMISLLYKAVSICNLLLLLGRLPTACAWNRKNERGRKEGRGRERGKMWQQKQQHLLFLQYALVFCERQQQFTLCTRNQLACVCGIAVCIHYVCTLCQSTLISINTCTLQYNWLQYHTTDVCVCKTEKWNKWKFPKGWWRGAEFLTST